MQLPKRIENQGPMVIAKGKGIKVWDDQGNEYIEAMAGEGPDVV